MPEGSVPDRASSASNTRSGISRSTKTLNNGVLPRFMLSKAQTARFSRSKSVNDKPSVSGIKLLNAEGKVWVTRNPSNPDSPDSPFI